MVNDISHGAVHCISPSFRLGIALVVGLQVCALQNRVHSLTLISITDRVGNIVGQTLSFHLTFDIMSFSSSSPGVVVANTNTVGASLAVWLASGLLAWTGASSFAELGSAIPQNGGAQAYLSYAYGPLISYLFAWTAIIGLKPGATSDIIDQ